MGYYVSKKYNKYIYIYIYLCLKIFIFCDIVLSDLVFVAQHLETVYGLSLNFGYPVKNWTPCP